MSPRRRSIASRSAGDGLCAGERAHPDRRRAGPPARRPVGRRLRQALRVGAAGREQKVAQVDLRRRAVVRTVKLPFAAGGIAIGDGAVFVTERGGAPGVARISTAHAGRSPRAGPSRRAASRSSDPAGSPRAPARCGSPAAPRSSASTRETGRVQHRFPLAVTATLLQFAGGDLWAASSENGSVEKIDPAVDRIVARATLHGWLSAMTVAGGSVWADGGARRRRLPPQRRRRERGGTDARRRRRREPGRRRRRGLRGRARASARSRGSTSRSGARATIALTGVAEARALPRWSALDRGDAGAPALRAAASGPRGARGGRTTGNSPLDPASGVDPVGAQLHYSTCMKLVNYPDAAGAAGQRLRPEAAAALPSRSADGRTYTLPDPARPALLAAVGRAGRRRRVQADARAHALAPRSGPTRPGLAIAERRRRRRGLQRAAGPSDVRGIVARGSELSITTERAVRRPRRPGSRRRSSARSRPARRRPATRRGRSRRRGRTTCARRLADRLVLDRNPNYRGPRPRRPARIVYLTGVPTGEGRRARRRRPGRRRALGLRPARPGGARRRARRAARRAAATTPGGARGRHARVQHAPAALPRRAPAPRRQLRARPARARRASTERRRPTATSRPPCRARGARRLSARRARTSSAPGRSPAAAPRARRVCTSAAIRSNLRDRARPCGRTCAPIGIHVVIVQSLGLPVGSRPEGADRGPAPHHPVHGACSTPSRSCRRRSATRVRSAPAALPTTWSDRAYREPPRRRGAPERGRRDWPRCARSRTTCCATPRPTRPSPRSRAASTSRRAVLPGDPGRLRGRRPRRRSACDVG